MSKFANERDEPVDMHGFESVLEASRVDSLSSEDMDNYQDMLTAVKNEIRSAHLYDIQQAEARARAEMAKAFKALDVPAETIAKATGISLEEIANL